MALTPHQLGLLLSMPDDKSWKVVRVDASNIYEHLAVFTLGITGLIKVQKAGPALGVYECRLTGKGKLMVNQYLQGFGSDLPNV